MAVLFVTTIDGFSIATHGEEHSRVQTERVFLDRELLAQIIDRHPERDKTRKKNPGSCPYVRSTIHSRGRDDVRAGEVRKVE